MEMFIIIFLCVLVVILLLVIAGLKSRLAGKTAADAVIITEKLSEDADLNTRLRQLLREGSKIKAIKELRTVHPLPLVEAKNYVEKLEREM
ncbi:hypothetical protein [Alkalicoccobacillus murimartini]|uniref:Ribosomal protein L7/L12 n=1 Tax=Alkalicoccobacillus murimartini TaxID=171685 RepID=A0ABT9YGB4_9BACI|nr:hypothetical protein [Alkalicoccobacillus murimartini]MDQ0206903.1 ribosomal protein L7/L12 [Alkalicoccobacillus murimartini]